MKRLIVLACLALAACASDYREINGSGVKTTPPWGYSEMCAREPANPLCGKQP